MTSDASRADATIGEIPADERREIDQRGVVAVEVRGVRGAPALRVREEEDEDRAHPVVREALPHLGDEEQAEPARMPEEGAVVEGGGRGSADGRRTHEGLSEWIEGEMRPGTKIPRDGEVARRRRALCGRPPNAPAISPRARAGPCCTARPWPGAGSADGRRSPRAGVRGRAHRRRAPRGGASWTGSGRGTDDSRARVYGIFGAEKSMSTDRELDDPSQVHHGHPVRDVLHHREIVRDEQIRESAPLLEVAQQVDHLRLHGHVERRDGLVAHDEARVHRERARDADALALAAGELVRIARRGVGAQPHLVEQRVHALRRLRRRRRCGGWRALRARSRARSCADRASAKGSWKTICISRRRRRIASRPSASTSRPSKRPRRAWAR